MTCLRKGVTRRELSQLKQDVEKGASPSVSARKYRVQLPAMVGLYEALGVDTSKFEEEIIATTTSSYQLALENVALKKTLERKDQALRENADSSVRDELEARNAEIEKLRKQLAALQEGQKETEKRVKPDATKAESGVLKATK